MVTVTLSDKYQVVIPKEIRAGLRLKPGQKLRISKMDDGSLKVETKSIVDELYGALAGKKIWGDDPATYIRKEHDEWDEHQKKLDDLWQK